MRLGKKSLAALLALAMLLGTVPAALAAERTVYLEGYSIQEIAKLLRLPAATVGTRLSRGRDRLRQMLKEDV